MAIYQPYFYVIQDTRNGIYYAGAKWAKDSDPSAFMIMGGYQTSSETIKTLIEMYGLSAFVVRKLRVFSTALQAQQYETRFLRRVNAKKHPKFYNGHNNDGAMDHQKISFIIREIYGVENISQSEYWKQIVPQKLRRPKTENEKKSFVEAHKSPITKKKHSDNMKRTRSNQSDSKKTEIGMLGGIAGKGNLWWNNGTTNLKSRENPGEDWESGRITDWNRKGSKSPKEIVICPVCNKSGGKPVMNRFHFENCKSINT